MNPVFTETQKFNKWWHYLLAGLQAFFAAAIYIGIWMDLMPLKGEQKKDAVILTLIASLLFALLFFLWFFVLKLRTTINNEGIIAQFEWLPFCKRTIKWEDIQSISLIKYSPFIDYGGWGVRYSMSGNGWCYNVSGNDGIKIIIQNKIPFLLGTQQKEEAEKIINFYHKK